MYILNPDPYLIPDYKISPFNTFYIASNNRLPEDNSIDDYFVERFGSKKFVYTINARRALYKALDFFQLNKQEDYVTILTTTGNSYISSCVTGEVEKFCKWNREIGEKTKVILVIHEFGFPYPKLNELKKYNLPIIEDAAYAFFTTDELNLIGNTGEFVIYSFPKMFPLQIGGLLVGDKTIETDDWDLNDLSYVKKVLSRNIQDRETICDSRLKNYHTLKKLLGNLNLNTRFNLEPGTVPGIFMFKDDGMANLPGLKTYLFQHGIQCSVFYGEEAFFIPVHQDLLKEDLDYFYTVIKSYYKL